MSIDADLIEGATDGLLALAGGCVCCSFGDDLIGTLLQAARREPRPDVVLLDCSGVSLPAALARSAALAPDVHVEGVVVGVDAAQVQQLAAGHFVGDTMREQLRQAPLLILNEKDRCKLQEMPSVRAWLAELAAGVPLVDCAYARVLPDLVLGLRVARQLATADWQGSGGRYRPVANPAPHRMGHSERYVTLPVDPQASARQLVAADGGRPLRAKRLVPLIEGRRWRVQVRGRRVEVPVFQRVAAGMPARWAAQRHCPTAAARAPLARPAGRPGTEPITQPLESTVRSAHP